MTYRKKLIEVALPLDAVNVASAREKSIRHGSTSTPLRRFARGEGFDEQAMPGLDSEAIDFVAASESFAPVRKLTRADLETLRLGTVHQRRKVPTARATRTRLVKLVERGLVREIGTSPQDPRRRYFRTDVP